MKTFTISEFRAAAHEEYPNAVISLFDRDRHVLTKAAWNKLHRDFVFLLQTEGLSEYGISLSKGEDQRFEINDCDDYMIHFMSYVSKRHAKTPGVTNALAKLCMLYNVEGDPRRAHAIIAPFFIERDNLVCRALEPQPNGGLFRCTLPERHSCYSLFG